MGYIYKNITGNTATEIAKKTYESKYNKISFCNVHASDAVVIDLYISRQDLQTTIDAEDIYTEIENTSEQHVDGNNSVNPYTNEADFESNRNEDRSYDEKTYVTRTYYILKNLTIPYGQTLILSEDDLCYNMKKYKLNLKLNNADSAVDVIINAEEIEEETGRATSAPGSRRSTYTY